MKNKYQDGTMLQKQPGCCHLSTMPVRCTGFTLIELLVVVLIIGILSAVALPQYTAAVQKARMSEAVQLGGSMITAQQAHFLAANEYTEDLSSLDLNFPLENNKNFTHKFLFITDPSCALLDLKSVNQSFGNLWIATYFREQTINCAAAKTSEEGNAFCRKYGADVRECPCQPAYNCYQIH